MQLQSKVLSNGVTIVSEYIPHVRSVSFGLWLSVGSRYETPKLNGASHFIEHMMFKGTPTHTAADIASKMDVLGGQLNAFTTKECTCYYGRVLDYTLRDAIDLLADMLFHASFLDEHIENERGVIREEIDMYEDDPEDLAAEQIMSAVFPDNPLGMSVLGTRESIAGLTRENLLAFREAHYAPNRLVIAVSGKVADEDLAYIEAIFSRLKRSADIDLQAPCYQQTLIAKPKEIEQNHLCLIFPGLSVNSDDRYAAQLFSGILGGGMSSRLFQTVREEMGLCYNIGAFGASYRETGLLGIYAGLNADAEEKAIKATLGILKALRDHGCHADELDRARERVKSNVLMSLESTSSRMNSLGRSTLFRGKVSSPEEINAAYDAVTLQDIRRVAKRLIDFSNLSLSAVGQVADEDVYRNWVAEGTR